jgi:hypothetical protein
MIGQRQIPELVALLESRGVYLYHACQLADFASYLTLGGVPSRALLEQANTRYTEFVSDSDDHRNGVRGKAFVNLSDFGRTFASGGRAVPNPYGPVLIVLHPSALADAIDVAICLRSASHPYFKRDKDSLNTLNDVDNLFAFPASVGIPSSANIKYKSQLRESFDNVASDPEVSCSVQGGMLALKYVHQVVVDPYRFSKGRLLDHVARIAAQGVDASIAVERQNVIKTRLPLYNRLAKYIVGGVESLDGLKSEPGCGDDLMDWVQALCDLSLQEQFYRYARYLREGTLLPLKNGTV